MIRRIPIEPADPSQQLTGARTELESDEVRLSEETVEVDSEPTVKSEPGRSAPRLKPGEVVAGRFIVRRFIARGGMGEVYEAEDQELRSRVALKTVLANFATDDTALERLKREVLLGRRVSHPNVCRTHELYVTRTLDGEPLRFLTMEFLEGETLARRLRREGRLSTDETRVLLKHIVAALDAAHAEGVIHRDFKSSNVLLVPRDEDGSGGTVRAVVTDFGIARVAHPVAGDSSKVKISGQVTTLAGTPAYMAPEQLTGGELSPATDVYALGVVLYEMLTGELPFPGDSHFQRPREQPVPPRSRVPNLSQRWNAAVLRCLEPQPERRFRTAQEVLRAVEGSSPPLRQEAVPGLTDPVTSGLYTRASEALVNYDPWECRRAVALLEQVTTLEPQFAAGWARLSAACLYMGTFFEPEDHHWMHRAEQSARKALAVNPDDADAHCALARTLWTPANSFQHRAALTSFSHALRLDPGCQQALTWKGGVLSHVGLLREADELLKEAIELRPDESAAVALLVQNAYYDNRFDEAEEVSARGLSRNPTDSQLLSFRPAAALYTNRLEDAEMQIRQARQVLPDNPVSHGHEALLWALRGEGLRTEECVARAVARKVLLTTHHAWHYAAAALAVLDRPQEALALLERAASAGLPAYPAFRDDRFLAKLKDRPAYHAWLVGLEREWLEYRRDFGSPPE